MSCRSNDTIITGSQDHQHSAGKVLGKTRSYQADYDHEDQDTQGSFTFEQNLDVEKGLGQVDDNTVTSVYIIQADSD